MSAYLGSLAQQSWCIMLLKLNYAKSAMLGSVEQQISIQNFIQHGILGTDLFSMDPSIVCTELCQISNGWVQI